MKYIFLLFVLLNDVALMGQPNCNAYKFTNDTVCYRACLEALKATKAQEGSMEENRLYKKSTEICPAFDYSFYEMSLPYLRRGDFANWKKYVDKAVALNPKRHLGWRAWSRFQFLHDYGGAIADIDLLDSLTSHNVGYSTNGDYQLNIAKALCYKGLGDPAKGIEIIERQLLAAGYTSGPFDYLHLGVMKLESNDLMGAMDCLKKQLVYNDYQAETYYYLGMTWKALKIIPEAKAQLEKARSWYAQGYRLSETSIDKIYLTDIETGLAELN